MPKITAAKKLKWELTICNDVADLGGAKFELHNFFIEASTLVTQEL